MVVVVIVVVEFPQMTHQQTTRHQQSKTIHIFKNMFFPNVCFQESSKPSQSCLCSPQFWDPDGPSEVGTLHRTVPLVDEANQITREEPTRPRVARAGPPWHGRVDAAGRRPKRPRELWGAVEELTYACEKG